VKYSLTFIVVHSNIDAVEKNKKTKMSKTQITHEDATTELLRGKQIIVKIHDGEFKYKFVTGSSDTSYLEIISPNGSLFSKRAIERTDLPKRMEEANSLPHVTFWTKDIVVQEAEKL
jgi:hypothetical protein